MMVQKYLHWEKKLSLFLKNRSITLLRFALALIFFWFGLLKVLGISPAEEMVRHATNWAGVHHFVTLLGVWEMAIGVFLAIRPLIRVGLVLMFLQFPGTFLPLFINPEDCFTYFPYGLTLEGQYIMKNLILISAGLVIIGSLHRNKANQKSF